jgi:polyisoprenyl-phosphate glycosyltransferase
MMEVSIVVPCYNEQDVLPETARRLFALLDRLQQTRKIGPTSCVYFVDDGSRDRTWEVIEELAAREPKYVRALKLSHNRGHQNALLAGLLAAGGDVLISVDADLQDDLDAIESMLDVYADGTDIVYGVRKSRTADSFFKRFSAEAYYKLLAVMDVEVVFNHSDFRLMSRRSIEALRRYDEVNLFLRGIIPQLGFPSSIVCYDRAERFAGESKYPLRKMLAFAIQGITSFSAAPLRWITWLGLSISGVSFGITLWAIGVRLLNAAAVPGWASTVVPIYFLGGIQLLCIGIIGEYLAKIYMETKRRPRYTIEKSIEQRQQVTQLTVPR